MKLASTGSQHSEVWIFLSALTLDREGVIQPRYHLLRWEGWDTRRYHHLFLCMVGPLRAQLFWLFPLALKQKNNIWFGSHYARGLCPYILKRLYGLFHSFIFSNYQLFLGSKKLLVTLVATSIYQLPHMVNKLYVHFLHWLKLITKTVVKFINK